MMINPTDADKTTDGFDARELRLLEEIVRSPHVTQRSLSRKLTIGLGMTNLLIRRLVAKGYVRATQAGWRSWAYSLTPQGMSRRVRLVRSYVHRVLGDYRSIRESLAEELSTAGMAEGARVAIYYPSREEDASGRDIAELVYLALKDRGVDLIDVFGAAGSDRFLGMPVQLVTALRPAEYDWVVVASLDGHQQTLEALHGSGLLPERVLTPLGRASQTVTTNDGDPNDGDPGVDPDVMGS